MKKANQKGTNEINAWNQMQTKHIEKTGGFFIAGGGCDYEGLLVFSKILSIVNCIAKTTREISTLNPSLMKTTAMPLWMTFYNKLWLILCECLENKTWIGG